MTWWTVEAERTLTEFVPAEPAAVRAVYVDLEHIADLHPLVVSVRRISRTVTADATVSTYRIKDRIPLGPFALSISYRARIEVAATGEVTSQAHQFPAVRLDSLVRFDPAADGTTVTERLRVSAPRPLAAITVAQGVAAHLDTWAAIRRRFEA